MYLLVVAQVSYYERIQAWSRKLSALQLLLRVCSLLGADKGLAAPGFAQARGHAGKLNRALERSPLTAALPGSKEYADWFWLANVNHYFKTIKLVFGGRDFLFDCYRRCALLEADVALARHLLSTRSWCWASTAASSRALALDDAVHPLLDGAAPLSIALEGKGAFISGQNGVGKSTFLRTLGLSLVTARAFGFCHARHARVPALPVYASMQSEDSLLGGESLYIAELRRARELLQAAHSGIDAIYLIDEIFRGTNHVESVSAAAAVLDTLAAQSLVLVSSHNVVLAALLRDRLDPYCIAREGGALAVCAGVLLETNGVALFGAQGFAPVIAEKAERVARWLGGYLAEPSAAAGVLRPAVSAAPA
jgi:DNA mismatch repair ATPase MutS